MGTMYYNIILYSSLIPAITNETNQQMKHSQCHNNE